MTKIVETKFEITSWDEKPYREFDDGRKFARAEVTLAGTGDGLTGGSFESLLYYRADGTSEYVSIMEITGTLDGRSGSFVLQGAGTYDGKAARVDVAVVPGSGTGELAGISGTAESVSTHADYPHMPLTIRYELA
ncbi:hypothetical protein Ais01nite_35620 [Asanoa ishikariensis]|uniref:DUF3224 domain-containing protein n=1 Tax=Asanoa ishikariensis TaxID=137265 RepID=A0A1H3LJU9_9ACTN|nr:DUF3224 domain-containing protein [Asanoa ishikariensis]GIF65527.1 hypothetical protein Ais01nite_35620 [Asanoa ishikariensis]SDY64570.1 Protein of unknown function [Asanoa ishikariensis]